MNLVGFTEAQYKIKWDFWTVNYVKQLCYSARVTILLELSTFSPFFSINTNPILKEKPD